jgi:hypothetical protein
VSATTGTLALDVVPLRTESASLREPAGALSRREATLRSAATAAVAGIALAQALGLPSLLTQGRQFVAVSIAAAALCLALSLALAVAPADAGRPLWRAVAAASVLVLAAWALPHATALPGMADAPGDWTAMPGAACAALAAACLALTLAALRPVRATLRGLATAAAVLVALGPGVGALLVAVGPGPVGGETAITADVHVHAHSMAAEPDIRIRRGPNGNHYVTPVARPPRAPAVGVALVVAASLVFVYGAAGYLRRRTAPLRLAAEGRSA